ncbi:MAG: helix-turn-helix domain-containing protein [Casimicrobiaceae bacterium]
MDALLLQAGRELFPEHGVHGLSVRMVAERAGVNLGMFHYHFRSKRIFVQALLQDLYDEMFAHLELAASAPGPVDALRRALNVLGRFARDNARLLRRLMADAMAQDPLALEFLRANMPRHVGVLLGLVQSAQRAGAVRKIALPQAIAFLAGSVAAPLVIGGGLRERALLPASVAGSFMQAVATDTAIAERVDCALAGLAVPRARRSKAAR